MPVDYGAKKIAYVTRLQAHVIAFMEAMGELDEVRKEWVEAGFGAGGPAEIVDEDLTGAFPAITALDLGDVINSIDAYNTTRDAGHGVNFQRLRP